MPLIEEVLKVQSQLKCLYSLDDIGKAMDQMAVLMTERLADKNPVFICLLSGAIISFGNLMPRLNFPLEIDYAHVTRYGNEFQGGKNLLWKAVPASNLRDRAVVIFDDILDEGLTLAAVTQYCQKQGAKEVFSAVLLDKQRPRPPQGLQNADFTCLKIQNDFVVGYGLDYKNYLRNLPGIYLYQNNLTNS